MGGTPPKARSRPRFTVPVAVLLFPAASVLGYMSQNLRETAPADVLATLAAATGCAVAVWLLVAAVRRRADAGAAVIACLWVVVGLFYLGLFGALNTWIGGDYTMAAVLPLVIVGLLAASVAVSWLGQLDAPIHLVLSVMAAVMVATPLWRVAHYEWRHRDARTVYDPADAAAEMVQFSGPAPNERTGRDPDIYHFVFDRYGSAETLAAPYGVGSSIGDLLEERGFYVAQDSHSNYLKTGHSLASTFYMDYLDLLEDEPRVAGDSWHAIFAMLRDHRVARFLQDRGYGFLQFGSWWKGTHENARADENHPYGFSEFTMYYLRHTVLRAAIGAAPQSRLAKRLDWDNGQCQRVARQVEQIKAIGARETPVYVFAHFLLPHDPFVFGPDGVCLPLDAANKRGSFQGYIDQVAFANRVIADLVGALQDAPTPPVILIQADEGPYPERDYDIPWQDAKVQDLRIKTGILNAYYFPDEDYQALDPAISPVNSYRILFNKFFGAHYPVLPDRIYTFPTDKQLFSFQDVTDRVRGDTGPGRATAVGPHGLRLR